MRPQVLTKYTENISVVTALVATVPHTRFIIAAFVWYIMLNIRYLGFIFHNPSIATQFGVANHSLKSTGFMSNTHLFQPFSKLSSLILRSVIIILGVFHISPLFFLCHVPSERVAEHSFPRVPILCSSK